MHAAGLKERVNELVARKTGLKPDEFGPASRLLHDLGVAGDDAAELLTEFAEQFDVDFGEFRFEQFFPGEPHLFNFWEIQRGTMSNFLPLTVEDLYRFAERKRLV